MVLLEKYERLITFKDMLTICVPSPNSNPSGGSTLSYQSVQRAKEISQSKRMAAMENGTKSETFLWASFLTIRPMSVTVGITLISSLRAMAYNLLG